MSYWQLSTAILSDLMDELIKMLLLEKKYILYFLEVKGQYIYTYKW
jgi:hypothetical protein